MMNLKPVHVFWLHPANYSCYTNMIRLCSSPALNLGILLVQIATQ